MSSTPLDNVRRMVLRYGWNSTAYQILNPGIDHWWARSGRGVTGFVRQAGVVVAAGAPICDAADIRAVNDELERDAAERDEKVCYFHALSRMEQVYRGSRTHTTIALGAQPVWDPHHWPSIVSRRSSLRAQLNRARNKAVTIHPESPASARAQPDLQAALEEWLSSRNMPAMHFMVEPRTLCGIVDDRRLWVARRNGDAVAFLLASPVPLRNGFLLEQIVRGRHAPNGTVELLIDTAMRDLAAAGHTYVTLGLVALATQANPEMRRNPLWLRFLMSWGRAHGRRFYNFDGLEAFRTKLLPDSWEPIYAIANVPDFSPRILYAILAAFSEGSPWNVGLGAFARAARQELRWLSRWIHTP